MIHSAFVEPNPFPNLWFMTSSVKKLYGLTWYKIATITHVELM